MRVQIRNVREVAIIDCTGDVDLYSSSKLREALAREIQPGKPSVLLNMSGVSYIDSSGIATLAEGLQLSRQFKTRFGLFALRQNARSVLEIARLHKVFTIFKTEQEAVENIASANPAYPA